MSSISVQVGSRSGKIGIHLLYLVISKLAFEYNSWRNRIPGMEKQIHLLYSNELKRQNG